MILIEIQILYLRNILTSKRGKMKNVPKRIQRAFDKESLQIIDNEQVEELKRWQKMDFSQREPDNHKSNSEVIIVSGCGRSGTTLMRVLLDTHSKIYAGPEALGMGMEDIYVANQVKKRILGAAP
jgi:hypothetical protein